MLIDTCTFLWAIAEPEKLSHLAKELLEDRARPMYLSAVSVWEIVAKHASGKLPLPESPQTFVSRYREALGFSPLPLDERAVFHLARLPMVHRDPFDRMLVCQAIQEGLAVLTPDPLIRQYPVRTDW